MNSDERHVRHTPTPEEQQGVALLAAAAALVLANS